MIKNIIEMYISNTYFQNVYYIESKKNKKNCDTYSENAYLLII